MRVKPLDVHDLEVNGQHFVKRNVSDAGEHRYDHEAIWEALVYLSKRVMFLENMIDREE